MRKAARWFRKEIDILFPKAYPRWMPKFKKWFIVRDYHKPQPGVGEYDAIAGKHFIVVKVLEENGVPAELTGRTIRALRILVHEGTEYSNLNNAYREADKREEDRARAAARYAKTGKQEFYKWVAHLKTKRTFS